MEFRVEGEKGCTMPEGCFISVRVGDMLKQGRYEPSRCYHFPPLERRRHAKVDIFRHVGSCQFSVEQDDDKLHHVQVDGKDLEKALRLQIHAKPWLEDKVKAQVKVQGEREAHAKTLKKQAMDYMSKHGIEERLAKVVKALLKEQPSHPTEFICSRLRDYGSYVEKAARPAAKQPEAEPAPTKVQQPLVADAAQAVGGVVAPLRGGGGARDLPTVRKQVCHRLMAASNDGELDKVIAEMQKEQKAPAKGGGDVKRLTTVRKQVCDVLLAASTDGELDKVLAEMKEQKQKVPLRGGGGVKDLPTVRKQVCGALMDASTDGELDRVLAEIKKEQIQKAPLRGGGVKDLPTVRKQVCGALMAASTDGELDRVLAEIKKEQKQKALSDVRLQACDVLMKASINGELGKFLGEVKAEQKASLVGGAGEALILARSVDGLAAAACSSAAENPIAAAGFAQAAAAAAGECAELRLASGGDGARGSQAKALAALATLLADQGHATAAGMTKAAAGAAIQHARGA